MSKLQAAIEPEAFSRGHESMPFFQGMGVCRWRHQKQARANAALVLRRQFTANGEVLEWVEVFKYLGHLLSQDDNDSWEI